MSVRFVFSVLGATPKWKSWRTISKHGVLYLGDSTLDSQGRLVWALTTIVEFTCQVI
jgi:hypothetical protein